VFLDIFSLFTPFPYDDVTARPSIDTDITVTISSVLDDWLEKLTAPRSSPLGLQPIEGSSEPLLFCFGNNRQSLLRIQCDYGARKKWNDLGMAPVFRITGLGHSAPQKKTGTRKSPKGTHTLLMENWSLTFSSKKKFVVAFNNFINLIGFFIGLERLF